MGYVINNIGQPGAFRYPVAPAPAELVYRIDFADEGQDFTSWFVRNGVVIDCQPYQGRVWVGTLILDPVAIGARLRIATRETARELLLNHPVTAFETLGESESLEVVGIGRKWANTLGIPASDLNL